MQQNMEEESTGTCNGATFCDGLLQFILAAAILGWIWSIFIGLAIFNKSLEARDRDRDSSGDNIPPGLQMYQIQSNKGETMPDDKILGVQGHTAAKPIQSNNNDIYDKDEHVLTLKAKVDHKSTMLHDPSLGTLPTGAAHDRSPTADIRVLEAGLSGVTRVESNQVLEDMRSQEKAKVARQDYDLER